MRPPPKAVRRAVIDPIWPLLAAALTLLFLLLAAAGAVAAPLARRRRLLRLSLFAAVYLAVVAVCHIGFGMSSDLPLQVFATAVAAAALFPLRDRVQRRVDRLFYGDRGMAYEALARLGRLVEESSGTDSALITPSGMPTTSQ